MCTAVSYKTKDFYFGRNLDYDHSYQEQVVITPRNYVFPWKNKYAMIGMAHVSKNYPLYYDACNEKGLAMAGLNFVGYAIYHEPKKDKINIAQFEFISFILSTCASVKEAKDLLKNINITNQSFDEKYPIAHLHYLLADEVESITIEPVQEGLEVYDNPVGVLTNNPPFSYHLLELNRYMGLSTEDPKSSFSKQIQMEPLSRGMGAIGLPGDLSSSSRFIRAAFVKLNSIASLEEEESVGQFFHILGSVEQQKGCCKVKGSSYEITIYTSCINATKGIYYYKTYTNHQITAIYLHHENLEGNALICYRLILNEQIRFEN